MLRDARAYLSDIIDSCDAISVAVRDLDLAGYEGKQAMVRSGWIIEHGSNTPRLTSCYPL